MTMRKMLRRKADGVYVASSTSERRSESKTSRGRFASRGMAASRAKFAARASTASRAKIAWRANSASPAKSASPAMAASRDTKAVMGGRWRRRQSCLRTKRG